MNDALEIALASVADAVSKYARYRPVKYDLTLPPISPIGFWQDMLLEPGSSLIPQLLTALYRAHWVLVSIEGIPTQELPKELAKYAFADPPPTNQLDAIPVIRVGSTGEVGMKLVYDSAKFDFHDETETLASALKKYGDIDALPAVEKPDSKITDTAIHIIIGARP